MPMQEIVPRPSFPNFTGHWLQLFKKIYFISDQMKIGLIY